MKIFFVGVVVFILSTMLRSFTSFTIILESINGMHKKMT